MYAVCPIVAATMSDAPTGRWPTGRTPTTPRERSIRSCHLASPPPNRYVCPSICAAAASCSATGELRDFTCAGGVDQDRARDRGIVRVEAADRQRTA